MALERVREKAKLTEEELFELRNWKVVTEQKLKLAEQARDEYQKMTEELKTVLEDKESELRLAKEKVVQEYRDSDALLTELGVSYNDGFNDALHQAKALYPKLDFSTVNINVAEAMGETGLFSIAQVRARCYLFIYLFILTITKTPFRRQAMLMTKGLMDRSLYQEMALERVREKAKLTEEELFELRNWKVVTEQKLKLVERARDEYQKMMEELKTVLEDKENELRLAKEKAVQEYRDSDTLLTELGVSYNDGFDDALRQAKALYPKLDFSAVNINIAKAMSVQPDASDDTNELFAEERPVTVVPEVYEIGRASCRERV